MYAQKRKAFGEISDSHGGEYGMLRRVVWQNFTDVPEVLAATIISRIALMLEAASTFETSVNLYQTTRRNIPEDGRLRKAFVCILQRGQAHRSKGTCSHTRCSFLFSITRTIFLVSISFPTEVCNNACYNPFGRYLVEDIFWEIFRSGSQTSKGTKKIPIILGKSSKLSKPHD
jgi:hypothetical protein